MPNGYRPLSWRQWGLTEVGVRAEMLRTLQEAIREGRGKVTAAVRDGREVVAVWPGFSGSRPGGWRSTWGRPPSPDTWPT